MTVLALYATILGNGASEIGFGKQVIPSLDGCSLPLFLCGNYGLESSTLTIAYRLGSSHEFCAAPIRVQRTKSFAILKLQDLLPIPSAFGHFHGKSTRKRFGNTFGSARNTSGRTAIDVTCLTLATTLLKILDLSSRIPDRDQQSP